MRRAAVGVGIVILETKDRLGVMKSQRFAKRRVKHVRRHAGIELVNETEVGTNETSGSRRHVPVRAIDPERMARHDLLDECAGTAIVDRRADTHAFDVLAPVGKKPSFREDGGGKPVAARGKFRHLDGLARFDAVDQGEVG